MALLSRPAETQLFLFNIINLHASVAEHFGLPLPPPSKASDRSFRKGANFAITGATALDSPFFKARGLNDKIWNTGSLSTQLQWFESLKPSLCSSPEGSSLIQNSYLRASKIGFYKNARVCRV